jgi:hypothetical protein
MMDDLSFPFDLNDLFEIQTKEDELFNLDTDLLSVLADGDTDQFFDVQSSLPNELLDQQESVDHDHQYCGEKQRPRKRKLDTDDSLFSDISTVCLSCHCERPILNGQQICTDCQLTNGLVLLCEDEGNQDENGRNSSESGEDNGYCSMVGTASPSSVSDADSSSEQAAASPIVSQPNTPTPVKPSVTGGLQLLAYLPIPKLSPKQPDKCLDCSKPVELTEEEKEALKAEGLPIPTTWPLTKTEEKALRVVRRKLRNKVCAAISRQRKKEYISSLEHK